MDKTPFDVGIIGLGVMGRNFALNISDHGFRVAGFDEDSSKSAILTKMGGNGKNVYGAFNLQEFVTILARPKTILLFVPAGPPVDDVLKELMPFLENGDIVIDGGNSYFHDTELRQEKLMHKGVYLLGVGVSGGEHGARSGASIMVGGEKSAYERVKQILKSCAAITQVGSTLGYMGSGGSGHYVKMIHNGIEYGIMQLIAETYDIAYRGLGLSNDELAELFSQWNKSSLNSYLIEITSKIFKEPDPFTDGYIIDQITDSAKQKGTGRWASEESMKLGVVFSIINSAVQMRFLSSRKDEREIASNLYGNEFLKIGINRAAMFGHLQNALYASIIMAYSQGLNLLHAASMAYYYDTSFETVVRIWSNASIVRSQILDLFRSIYIKEPDISNPILSRLIVNEISVRRDNICSVVIEACTCGIPVQAFMAALSYYDALRSRKLPANLIQAQRDYFGAHTYERIDREGVFHTEWEKQYQG